VSARFEAPDKFNHIPRASLRCMMHVLWELRWWAEQDDLIGTLASGVNKLHERAINIKDESQMHTVRPDSGNAASVVCPRNKVIPISANYSRERAPYLPPQDSLTNFVSYVRVHRAFPLFTLGFDASARYVASTYPQPFEHEPIAEVTGHAGRGRGRHYHWATARDQVRRAGKKQRPCDIRHGGGQRHRARGSAAAGAEMPKPSSSRT